MHRIRLLSIVLIAMFAYACAGDVPDQEPGRGQNQEQGQDQEIKPGQDQGQLPTNNTNFPLHTNVSVTLFWVGEDASNANSYIPNSQSAWDDKWAEHYGGVDDPYTRNGYLPATFVPNENPFYFALPYNDFNGNGTRKNSVVDIVYWSGEKQWGSQESMCKNRWIQLIKGNKIAYAQWEDVGPYNEDDSPYVFGNMNPQSAINNYAGLDISPAVRDYLGLSDIDIVDWKFVDSDQVPDGPWKAVVTTTPVTWN